MMVVNENENFNQQFYCYCRFIHRGYNRIVASLSHYKNFGYTSSFLPNNPPSPTEIQLSHLTQLLHLTGKYLTHRLMFLLLLII